MVDQRLIDYVSSAVNKGHDAGQIKTQLQKRGWPEGDIDEAIYVVTRSTKTASQPETAKGRGHMKIYLAGLAIIVVIACITGLYIFSVIPFGQPTGGGSNTTEKCGNGVCDAGETYLSCSSDCQQPSGPATVSVSPASKTVNNGETFTLNVDVSNVADFFGFQFNVEYDHTILEFQTAGQGTFLSKSGQDTTFCVDYNSTQAGLVKNIACTRVGRNSVSGNGVIETLTFKAINSGTSDVKLTNVQLVSSKVENIASSVSNGMVIVS